MFSYLPKDNIACFLIGGGIVLAAVIMTYICYKLDDYFERRRARRDYTDYEEQVFYPDDYDV